MSVQHLDEFMDHIVDMAKLQSRRRIGYLNRQIMADVMAERLQRNPHAAY